MNFSMNREANIGAFSRVSTLAATYKKLDEKLMETNAQPTLGEQKKEIMSLLHEFNEVKDAAQIVIGALANMEGKTIKEIHIHYNLPTTE